MPLYINVDLKNTPSIVGLEVHHPPWRSQLCAKLSCGFSQSQTSTVSAQDLGIEELGEIQAASMSMEVTIVDYPIKHLVTQSSRHF
jgi:hypothetical protein